ncbi:MAG: DUF2889 domain-containing protein [Sphingobium sp.]
MSDQNGHAPQFPPGLWRRISIYPAAGQVVGGLEDDAHRFILRFAHADGVIVSADVQADRFPWSTCPGAAPFLAERLVGQRVEAVAALDAYANCTHLYELAVLCAAHAGDAGPVVFDLKVGDRPTSEDRTVGTLAENGVEVLRWDVHGTMIEGPGHWAGRDQRKLSTWKTELTPADAERAMMLRRAFQVSGARRQPPVMAGRAGERTNRMGACFTYQMPRAMDAVQSREWKIDFSATRDGPLQGFDPATMLATAGTR